MAEPGLSELVTTTLRRRGGKIQDNVTNNNPILYRMEKSGNIKKNQTGRTLVEETDYQENPTFLRYEGSDVLNTSQAPVLSAFEYNWKQAAVAVILNGLEQVQNDGIHASISLLSGRIDNAERTIKNMIESDIRSDGTTSKQIGGLDLLLAEDPTSGTVGGVDRATHTYARNYKYDATNDGGAAATAANIEGYMRTVNINTHRMGDKNCLWVLGNDYYSLLMEAITTNQRFVDEEMAGLGFENIKHDGITAVLGGGFQSGGTSASAMTATKGYKLNLDYLKLRVGKGRFFQPLTKRESVNQDATVRYLVFAGNLTCSNFGLQGVLFD